MKLIDLILQCAELPEEVLNSEIIIQVKVNDSTGVAGDTFLPIEEFFVYSGDTIYLTPEGPLTKEQIIANSLDQEIMTATGEASETDPEYTDYSNRKIYVKKHSPIIKTKETPPWNTSDNPLSKPIEDN